MTSDELLARFVRAFDLYANSDGRNAGVAFDELGAIAGDAEAHLRYLREPAVPE